MRNVEFRHLLDNANALRVRFEVDHGQVTKFVVQFDGLFNGNWVAIVRYDTAHNFAHCDRLHPYEGTLKTTMATQDFNEALTLAIQDLTSNWSRYRRRYEEWLRQR